MAVITAVLCSLEGDQVLVKATYDDVTLNLVSGQIVNASDKTFTATIYRPNGNVWRTIPVPPGTDEVISFPIGPIRDMEDIPTWSVSG